MFSKEATRITIINLAYTQELFATTTVGSHPILGPMSTSTAAIMLRHYSAVMQGANMCERLPSIHDTHLVIRKLRVFLFVILNSVTTAATPLAAVTPDQPKCSRCFTRDVSPPTSVSSDNAA